MTKEEFKTYALDLKDFGLNVWCGNVGDDRWDFDFYIENNPRHRKLSINDYSEILESLEIICDRLEEEYDLLRIKIEFSSPFLLSEIVFNKFELLDGRLPTSDEIVNRIEKLLKIKVKHSPDQLPLESALHRQNKIITHIGIHFDSKVYKKKQSDRSVMLMYNNMKSYDKETADKMRALFPDILKESKIRRFKDI